MEIGKIVEEGDRKIEVPDWKPEREPVAPAPERELEPAE